MLVVGVGGLQLAPTGDRYFLGGRLLQGNVVTSRGGIRCLGASVGPQPKVLRLSGEVQGAKSADDLGRRLAQCVVPAVAAAGVEVDLDPGAARAAVAPVSRVWADMSDEALQSEVEAVVDDCMGPSVRTEVKGKKPRLGKAARRRLKSQLSSSPPLVVLGVVLGVDDGLGISREVASAEVASAVLVSPRAMSYADVCREAALHDDDLAAGVVIDVAGASAQSQLVSLFRGAALIVRQGLTLEVLAAAIEESDQPVDIDAVVARLLLAHRG
jgi:hypothetical protein